MDFKTHNDTFIFCNNFNHRLNSDIYKRLKNYTTIIFGKNFNQSIDKIPNNITTIFFGNDFNQVLESSLKSQSEWANTTPLKRSRVLSKFKNLIEINLDELASIVSRQHGKTLDDSRGSITRGLEVVEFAIGIPHLVLSVSAVATVPVLRPTNLIDPQHKHPQLNIKANIKQNY